jgi:hypothetical protein
VCPSDATTAELTRLEADTTPGGAEVTVSTASAALVGAHPVCASVSLSKGHPLDILDTPIMFQPGFVPPEPEPHDPPAGPALTLASHVVHRRVRLRSVPAGTAVTVRIGRAGRTLARGKGHGSVVRIHLTRAGKRLLAHHRRVHGRLHASLLYVGAPRLSRTFKVTLVR